VSTEDLADRIGKIQGIEGVTFLGGEPFDQAAALGELAALVRLKGLSVMTFSGYTLQQLQDKADRGIDHLLAETDLLVDGPFIQARYTTTHPWIGSDNQTIHFLTDRYAHLASESPPLRQANSVEIRLTVNGELSLNGFAHAGMRAAILEELRSRGFDLNRTDLFPKPVDERDLS
jgi:anaerobic ribonucleoside-triphosphate reductase activating protein